jgi:sulfate permease, SulP family
MDFTAARAVEQTIRYLRARGVGFAVAHVRAGLRPDLDRHRLTELIGPTRLFDVLHEGVAQLRNELPS